MSDLPSERGMPDNHEIVFEREAEQAPNIIPGDVIVKLKTKKHAVFTRRGDDLLMQLSITLKEALVGFKRRVVHLDGVWLCYSRIFLCIASCLDIGNSRILCIQ